MGKIITTLLIFSIIIPVMAHSEDTWTSKDKAVHLFGHMASVQVFDGFYRHHKAKHPRLYSFVSTIALGLAYELYNESRGEGFSDKDAIVNVIGASSIFVWEF